MPRVLFDPNEVDYTDFFKTQFGYGEMNYYTSPNVYQRGYGGYYPRGVGSYYVKRQRGAGIGSVMRNIWNFVKPYAFDIGKAVGQEALKTTCIFII